MASGEAQKNPKKPSLEKLLPVSVVGKGGGDREGESFTLPGEATTILA